MQRDTHWRRPWCWERSKEGGEGDNRGWDDWMASPTQWTWVEQPPGDGDEQGGLACCDSWGHKESDTTERLNWTELNWTEPRQHIKKQRHHFANKGPYSKSYGFSSSHTQIWELDHRKGWVLKNWCFWTVVFEKRVLWTARRSNRSIV